jgi:phosphoribosylaminoimidazolecarboxamide formyltransferase/IMP cyclohydrolase
MVNIVQKVDNWVDIKHVLLSVSDKTNLEVLIPGLVAVNPDIRFYSTGGTYARVSEILGAVGTARHLMQVSDYTGQPETQGGLVKTLDFKIYLGLLTETYNEAHRADLVRTTAIPIDMVVVNLYPFEATVAREGVTVEEARANIDIGGPCMLRAAAKNYLRVTPIVDPADYAPLLSKLRANRGAIDLQTRFEYARKAFAHTASYDTAISAYLSAQNPADVPGVYQIVE